MGARRPLGAGIVTLIVVDAILVVVFLVMLIPSVSSPEGSADGGGTGTGATTPPADDAESVVFASPTRNIACTIGGDAARCEIAHIMYEPPTLEGCEGDVGHEIEVTADGARWVCRTDPPPAPPGDDVENLDWGDSVSANGFTCTSENDGVTCRHDESGHAFSLARRVHSLG